MPSRTRELTGRPAVITGAASGIGRALAQRLSALGSPVAIADVDETGLGETAKSLRGPVLTRVLDVRDAADQLEFAAEVREWLPAPLAAVFNNAGVAVAGTVLDGSPADDDWLHEINFRGVVHGTRAFLPLLAEQGSGAIVNTSSVFGLAGIPAQSAYCAAKFGVRGYTEALRHELRGSGVRAISVHPGGIKTNIVRNARFHQAPQGLARSGPELVERFDKIAMTTPEKAARIVHQGVERGKARILVGPDAVVFDALTRISPTHYYELLSGVQSALRRKERR